MVHTPRLCFYACLGSKGLNLHNYVSEACLLPFGGLRVGYWSISINNNLQHFATFFKPFSSMHLITPAG